MIKILVTGASGQLGLCLRNKATEAPNFQFVFLDSAALDITDTNSVAVAFNSSKFHYCINCAAYTAVDNAEDQQDLALAINTLGVKNLATACKTHNTILIHISTDFVFNGEQNRPYLENDTTSPLGVYGETKLKGEQEISNILEKYFIIRTSWLYSEHKNNFVKTMLRLAQEKEELGVVNDQKGTPTNANDLAMAILTIIKSNSNAFGLYHYSNLGETTWYGFAKCIFNITNTSITLKRLILALLKARPKGQPTV